jgi:hypothetical protein
MGTDGQKLKINLSCPSVTHLLQNLCNKTHPALNLGLIFFFQSVKNSITIISMEIDGQKNTQL